MADANNSLVKFGVVAAIGLGGFLIYSNLAAQRRMAEMEELLRAKGVAPARPERVIASSPPLPPLMPASKPNPDAPTPPPPPPEPPPAAPRSPESLAFAKEMHLDDFHFSRLRRFNDRWVKKLEDVKAGSARAEELAAMGAEREMQMFAVFGHEAGASDKYRRFVQSLPGPHVVVTLPDGAKVDGARFE